MSATAADGNNGGTETTADEGDGEEDNSADSQDGSGETNLTLTLTSKTLTVDASATEVEGETYTSIQDALDYISDQDDKDGWTITVESGTYTYFTVNQYISNLTIKGENGATVDCSDGSIQLMGDTITLEGLTFTAKDTAWSVPVIKDASSNAGLFYDSMVTIKNCDFIGTNAGCALWICRLNATVKDCTFDGFSYAIEIINETSIAAKIDTEITTGTITIDGNTVTNCDFFVHYGVRSGITFVVANNIVTGSSDKICASLFAWKGESITVTGNTFIYAAFGLQNAINGVSAKGFLDTNTFDEHSYVVDDYYNYSTKADYSATYYAKEIAGKTPVWSVDTENTGDYADKFTAALSGRENDNPLIFTTTGGIGDLVCMGLAYHAINLDYIEDPEPEQETETPETPSDTSSHSSSSGSGSSSSSSEVTAVTSAQTGDTTNIWLPLLGLLVAIAGLGSFGGAFSGFMIYFHERRNRGGI
ncbi:MAG: LPXTG cell wall anchor domain-containing protein [Lachnospiraceae bacterium]|nr:LPXTG cell wall anchor domain-containing protein [Lachnospiraceae bacterium]